MGNDDLNIFKQVFKRKIMPSDWTRFRHIAKCVKDFKITSESLGKRGLLNRNAITDLLLSRPEETVILPNLKGLHIHISAGSTRAALEFAAIFLHKGLKDLALKTRLGGSLIAREYEFFWELIAFRAPNLKSFDVQTEEGDKSNILSKLISTLNRQASLEIVYLTQGTLTTPILSALSHMPKLKQLSLSHDSGTDKYEAVKDLLCDNMEAEKCFPSLKYLDVQTRIVSVTRLIQMHPTFSRLESLDIDMVSHNNEKDIRRCLEAISSTCKKLEYLAFTRIHGTGDRSEVLEQETDPITKETLATLPSFRFLKRFTIEYARPITMTDDDLVGLLGGSPSLTKLILNPCPVKEATPKVSLPSLGVLHRILQCCPKLEKLSIYLDTSADRTDPDLLFNLSDSLPSFSKLVALNLGKSVIDEVKLTTLYLGQIIPQGCKFTFETGSNRYRLNRWEEVSNRLPSLIRACSEKRHRYRALEEEVETLKTKLTDLGG